MSPLHTYPVDNWWISVDKLGEKAVDRWIKTPAYC
jgi:hypothetical protein